MAFKPGDLAVVNTDRYYGTRRGDTVEIDEVESARTVTAYRIEYGTPDGRLPQYERGPSLPFDVKQLIPTAKEAPTMPATLCDLAARFPVGTRVRRSNSRPGGHAAEATVIDASIKEKQDRKPYRARVGGAFSPANDPSGQYVAVRWDSSMSHHGIGSIAAYNIELLAPPAEPTFTQADLDAARNKSYMAGYVEGERVGRSNGIHAARAALRSL